MNKYRLFCLLRSRKRISEKSRVFNTPIKRVFNTTTERVFNTTTERVFNTTNKRVSDNQICSPTERGRGHLR